MSVTQEHFETRGGIRVSRTTTELPVPGAVEPLIDSLDGSRGMLLASSYDYPGRYTRWDIGFCRPPLVLEARGREFELQALNARGEVVLPWICEALTGVPGLHWSERDAGRARGRIEASSTAFTEEQRSRQPSVFSVIRALRELFFAAEESHLGLYGAFGYDLAFQFEPVELKLPRSKTQRDLVLYLVDDLLIVQLCSFGTRGR